MSYNPFRLLTVLPNFNTGHILQWQIDPVFTGELPHQYTVEASEVPTFSELRWSKLVGDTFMAIDDTRTKQDWSDDLWYRVKLVCGDGKVFYSKNVLFGVDLETRRHYKLAQEITRKELILQRGTYLGAPSVLLKRKAFGPVATSNVDPISGVPIAHKNSNIGTAILNGFYDPIKIVCSTETAVQQRDLSEDGNGVTEVFQVQLRMVGYPSVDTQDVIVDLHDDRRYIVRKTVPTTLPPTNIIIVQQLTTLLIPSTDPIYTIPIR